MTQKRRLHDAIVGLLVTIGVALGHYVSAHWLLLPAAIGLTLLQSGVTGFCPVYFGWIVVSCLLKAGPTPPVVARSNSRYDVWLAWMMRKRTSSACV